MTSWIALLALSVLSLVVMLLPLWFARADRRLGSGVESDDASALWAQEKDRLLREQDDLDVALAEGKIAPETHAAERAAVADDAKRVLSRLRREKDQAEKRAVAEQQHKPQVYAKVGAVFACLIALTTGVLIFELKGLDIHRPQSQADARQVTPADIEKMVASLEKRVLAGEGSEQDRLMLARSYQVLGKQEKSVALYNEILKDAPDNMAALLALGELYFKSGDESEQKRAIGYFDRALALDANKPEALWFKSLSLVRMRDFKQARQLLVHLQKTATDNRQAQEAVARLLQELDKNITPPQKNGEETPNTAKN